ncbi:acetamidase [Xylariales sp. AK1849]|nr:acetamidase [Xylariales sp. AK1849]
MSDIRATTDAGATWQDVAVDRQRHRDATIAALGFPLPELQTNEISRNVTGIPKAILTDEEFTITGTDVEVLAAKLASGEWSATLVINAFLRRAGLAQKLVNCITELLPERALNRARELDEYLAAHKKPVGPLHGVPISVKEHLGMKGLDLNAGFVAWVGRISASDALILQILWEAGAVFYVRTTQPQTLMHLETSGNLYGVTVNPHNTALTAGGSSGGEGALIGMRGSILGIGTDIGGSIRSPAANNGIFGFKPTAGRLPVLGWMATMAGTEAILGTIGPLSTSLEGLKLFTKTIVDGKPWLTSPDLVAMEWRDTSTFFKDRKLKVAVMWEDGVVKPHPPIARAMTEAVEKLRKSAKIEVVEWKPWKHDLAWEIIAGLYFSDGGAEEKAAIDASGEPWRPLSHFILTDNPHVKHHDIASLWAACHQRNIYRDQYAALWNETAVGGNMVDVILCPAGPGVAPPLDAARYWGYTAQWNLLDYPAVVFPVSDCVNAHKDGKSVEYSPVGEKDAYNWNLWKEHGAEGYKDGPISLQLVARRYQDEKLLRSLEIILKETGLPATVS